MFTFKKLTLLLLFAVALMISLPSTYAQTEGTEDKAGEKTENVAERIVPAAEQQATDTLWAREERLKSEAMAFPEATDEDIAEDDNSVPLGPPGMSPGAMPDPNADAEAQRLFPEDWKDIEMPDEALEEVESGTRQIFTRYRGNHYTNMWKSYPWRAIGKLHFITPSGSSKYCTASVISTRVIVTAAHCLYSTGSGGGWHTNISFVPAERYGNAPYGSFSASRFMVVPNYITTGAARYDLGVVVLNNNSAGKPVRYYTGSLPRSWNYGYTQHLHSVGYASNLSTQYTHICAAESFRGGTDKLAMGCDMTYGSSGGPWIKNYAPYQGGSRNYVNSVVSGAYTTPSEKTFVGPRFTSNNIVSLCNWAGC